MLKINPVWCLPNPKSKRTFTLLKFPTIPEAIIRQNVFRGELGKSWKNRSRSYPYSYSIPFPDVLPEFYLRVHCSLVPIASFVISAHGVRTSQCCHQSPRGIAIGKQCVELPCQHSTFPYRLIITGSQFCTAKRIFIAEKSRTEPLVYPQIIAMMICICQEIT